MAEVGLAFLSASLGVLFHRMTSREVLRFMQGRNAEVLLRKFKNAMLSVKVVLEDAEEKQLTDSFVKDWVDELKDVIYEAEYILDKIATEALKRKLREGNLRDSASALLETFFKKVDEEIEKVLVRLEDLAKQKDFMGLQVGVGGKQYPERLSTSYVSESDTFGRDEDKEKVIDLLLSSDARGNEMRVIAIVGMGGIGKTTLAQLAYNDSRVQKHFKLKIWFCVSDEFVVPNVMKSIIDQSATSSARSTEDLEQLRVILKMNLTGKKFLLVLDDVWSEKSNHREFLGQLLKYGNQGSAILVTTRNDSVASAMHAIETYHLKPLPEDGCRSLFEKHAFRDGNPDADPKIKEIGTQIVEKCKGLPLAIKAIGDLLWSESNVERWTNISKSNLWDLPMDETYILPALRLSYKYLPSYLKRCFTYCSIFPKNHTFEKDQLVLLWMAEGFLQQSEIDTMEEVGNRYFDALVSRSLFQRHETKPGFVMHDLVNDLAKSVAGQFCTDSFEKIVKMTRYVSNFGSWVNLQDIKEDLLAIQLRTFLGLDFPRVQKIRLSGTILRLRVLSLDSRWITELPDSIGEMEYLRYLDVSKGELKGLPESICNLCNLQTLKLSGCDKLELPDSIGKMKYLRYLDVSGAELKRLPESICNLCNLQTLKLSGCDKLDRLPKDTCKLIKLRHLQIDGTSNLKEMPIEMGRLNCLQTLSKFVVSQHDSGSSIGELGKLINLRGELSILELQNVRSAENASLNKAYLDKLVLEWNIITREVSESQGGVLEHLQPRENLKILTINRYSGKGFPAWMGGLTSLSELTLIDCKYCSALPPLGQLPCLNCLWIDGLYGVVTVGPEFYGNSSNSLEKPFRSLKSLGLVNMLDWEKWSYLDAQNEVETFSQLKDLYIINCPKLTGMLSVEYLPSLKKHQILDCQHLSIDSP